MMGGMRGMSWSISSEEDPRWNKNGHVGIWAVTAGYPSDAKEWLEECDKKYNKRPEDLCYSCMKD